MNGARRQIRLLDRDQLDTLPDPQPLIDGLMQVQSSVVVYGPPGGGKTFFALDVGLGISTARDFHGRRAVGGTVVYVTSEGLAGLKVRIMAWEAEHGIKATRFYVVPDQPQLLNNLDVEGLFEAIGQAPAPIALIVIDTLARHFAGGDENKAQDIGRLVVVLDELRRRFRCSTMLVHHTGKDREDERGSSALRASADTMISVKKVSTKNVRIRCDKQKEDTEFKDMVFELTPIEFTSADGVIYSSCVLTRCGSSKATSSTENDDDIGLDDLSAHEQALLRVFVPNMEAIYRSTDLEKESGLKPATFGRVRKKLVDDAKLLEKTREGLYRLTSRGRAIVEAMKPV